LQGPATTRLGQAEISTEKRFFALGLILRLAGCASVGVRNPTQGAANPRSPSQIFVAEFDAGKGIFQVNRSGDELVAFEQKTAGPLADHLVADLSKSVVPASRQNDSSRPRGDAWLITGEFVRVNQGSRALRGLIGLGAGGIKIKTIVRVYDLSGRSEEPVLHAIFRVCWQSIDASRPGPMLGVTEMTL